MASSFQGWGNSWAHTWDRVSDPGAMYGSAFISFSASGNLSHLSGGRLGGTEWGGKAPRLDFKTTLDRIRERKNRFKAKRVIAASKPEAKKIESQFVEHVVNNSLTETVLESLFSKWTDVVNVEENNVYLEALMHRVLLRLREVEQNEEDELILMLTL